MAINQQKKKAVVKKAASKSAPVKKAATKATAPAKKGAKFPAPTKAPLKIPIPTGPEYQKCLKEIERLQVVNSTLQKANVDFDAANAQLSANWCVVKANCDELRQEVETLTTANKLLAQLENDHDELKEKYSALNKTATELTAAFDRIITGFGITEMAGYCHQESASWNVWRFIQYLSESLRAARAENQDRARHFDAVAQQRDAYMNEARVMAKQLNELSGRAGCSLGPADPVLNGLHVNNFVEIFMASSSPKDQFTLLKRLGHAVHSAQVERTARLQNDYKYSENLLADMEAYLSAQSTGSVATPPDDQKSMFN